jgi:hypothetical protein
MFGPRKIWQPCLPMRPLNTKKLYYEKSQHFLTNEENIFFKPGTKSCKTKAPKEKKLLFGQLCHLIGESRSM